MVSFIIWIVGVVLTIKAGLDIWRIPGDTIKKILIIVVVILTSWIGLLFYYFYGKDHIADWVK